MKKNQSTLLKNWMSCKRKPERGEKFTIIELLVVVAIIMILVSIFLPALGKARKTAKGMLCLSNQKQIGISFAEYAAYSKDIYPIQHCVVGENREWGYGHNWAYQLSYRTEYLSALNRIVFPKGSRCSENRSENTFFNAVYGWTYAFSSSSFYKKHGGSGNEVFYTKSVQYADGSLKTARFYDLKSTRNLSGLVYLACSTTASDDGIYMITRGSTPVSYSLYLAHNNRGSALFLDGHSELKTRTSWISYLSTINSWYKADILADENRIGIPF